MICEKFKNKKCIINLIIIIVWLSSMIIICRCAQKKIKETHRLVDEIEYVDSLNRYNKIYYESEFKKLKNTNKQLYDSLKKYKNQISYLIEFKHEKEYNTGTVTIKPIIKDSTVYDTIPMLVPQIARTYEYLSEPNDTFQYNLKVNSFTEPNWYSLRAKVSNKFTIVNKEENGTNHIIIDPHDGNSVISDVTVLKKKQRTTWERFSFGPSITTGYDPINKQWGLMIGVGVSYDLK